VAVGLRVARRGRSLGFTTVEILVAATIISFALLPALFMIRHNVETARLDRVRVFAESLCHNALERFGRSEDLVILFLSRSAGRLNIYTGTDLWKEHPDLGSQLGIEAAAELLAVYDIHMTVALLVNEQPGMDLLSCRVNWRSDRGDSRRTEAVSYARYLIHDHVH
jgi:hypothetical protein